MAQRLSYFLSFLICLSLGSCLAFIVQFLDCLRGRIPLELLFRLFVLERPSNALAELVHDIEVQAVDL